MIICIGENLSFKKNETFDDICYTMYSVVLLYGNYISNIQINEL